MLLLDRVARNPAPALLWSPPRRRRPRIIIRISHRANYYCSHSHTSSSSRRHDQTIKRRTRDNHPSMRFISILDLLLRRQLPLLLVVVVALETLFRQ
jgi:hypothetical protein